MEKTNVLSGRLDINKGAFCAVVAGARKASSGFTPIELLVVVLIIGILASVALPQYQKSVEKARAMEALTLVWAVGRAEERYFLANGEYTSNFEELDIDVPGSQTVYYQDRSGKQTKDFVCRAAYPSSSTVGRTDMIAVCYPLRHSVFGRWAAGLLVV